MLIIIILISYSYKINGTCILTGKADPLIIYKSAQEKAEFFKSLHFTKHELRSYPDLVHTIGPKVSPRAHPLNVTAAV